ncbi:MAG TPA: glutamine synthetase family protein [Prolixibacteraceae bacterium]|nr:glutamine synthetase family protein [Prolixibacteraceae bacterium]
MKQLNPAVAFHPNPLVDYFGKPSSEFTREDIIEYIEKHGIRMLNFRYVGEDGRLKMLNFVINSKKHLEDLLSCGERVDGSSLFSYVEAGSSDLYVIPRFRTAFMNPFTEEPTLELLCSFYNIDGEPLASAPEHILRKAAQSFRQNTGMNLKALGELEYYVISDKDPLFPGIDQKGYHAPAPFAKWEDLRVEALRLIAECGGSVKYAHSEVGCFSTEDQAFEQHEIEFLPVDIEDAADQLSVAKWILRMLAYRYGVTISFAPKITVGKAGSGLHIHMLLEKDGRNVMIDEEKGSISNIAKQMIAGLLDLAAPLTAFGNTIPVSYLRLVPHQEAPTNICWGDRNRSVLVRVPLGWIAHTSMIRDANPAQVAPIPYVEGKQTVELRSPDGSADIYLLMAGIAVAAEHGISMENGLHLAEEKYINVNIFKPEYREKLASLQKLPASCSESADALEEKRSLFEQNGVFPAGTINDIIRRLKAWQDFGMSERLEGKNDEIRALVEQFIHCR